METKELVFSSVENLVYPMLIVGKSDEKYTGLYANVAMKALLPQADTIEIEEPLLEMLQEYENQENKNSYTFYDIEIYDGFLHFILHKLVMALEFYLFKRQQVIF